MPSVEPKLIYRRIQHRRVVQIDDRIDMTLHCQDAWIVDVSLQKPLGPPIIGLTGQIRPPWITKEGAAVLHTNCRKDVNQGGGLPSGSGITGPQ